MKSCTKTKIPMKKIRKNKRHFQLLELMVAAFILLICIAPTMRIFTSMYLSQQEIIRENQRDHLAHLIHAHVTEQLYKHQIALPQEEGKNHPIQLSDPDLINQLKKLHYDLSGEFVIVAMHKPKGEEHADKYLAKLVIKLKDSLPKVQSKTPDKKFENQDPLETIYDYTIYIDAGAKNPGKKKTTDQDANPDAADKGKKSSKQPPVPSTDVGGVKQKK